MSYSGSRYDAHFPRVGFTSIAPVYYVANPGARMSQVLHGLGHGHGGGGWGGGGLYSGDGLPMEPTDFISSPLFGVGGYVGETESDYTQPLEVQVNRSFVGAMRGRPVHGRGQRWGALADSGDGLGGILAVL